MLAILITMLICGASTTRAQELLPFVDCVERERDGSGNLTGKFVAHFGYINFAPFTLPVTRNTAGNLFAPRNPPNQPDTFLPGVHPRVVSVTLEPGASASWQLSTKRAATSATTFRLCGNDSQNPRLMTYQGRLSDGSQTANGVYDLQFQLFNAQTGGDARTNPIPVEDVTVTNGVFTVQLNLGKSATVNPRNNSRDLNAAILAGEDGFFEIGVRPGNSPANAPFTVLTPRQPLTAVPLAMRADTANNAVHATFAGNAENLGGTAAGEFIKADDGRLSDARTPTAGSNNYIQNTTAQQTNSNFNISGNGAIGGNLTVGGTLSSNCRSGFTAIAGGRLCMSAMQAAATFYGGNGAIKICANLGARVGGSADLMLTIGTSLDYRGGLVSGWLADHIGDNVWAVWTNGFGETDFDGIPLNVTNGGANNSAPILPFRCVY